MRTALAISLPNQIIAWTFRLALCLWIGAAGLPGGEPPPLAGTTQEEGDIPDAVAPGVPTRFAARVPIDKKTGGWSLIVALHGMSSGDRVETRLLYYPSLGLLQHGIQTRYVVLGIAAQAKGQGWNDRDEPAITAAVTWALARWPIDPQRVYAYGISHGAMRLGHFAPAHSDLFAGVIAMSGNITGITPNIPPARDLQWYLMHGDADPVVNVSQSRNGAAALKQAGFPFVYREFTGQAHIYGKAVTDTCHADAIHWFETLRRATPPTPAEEATIASLTAWIGGKKPAGKTAALLAKLLPLAGTSIDVLVGQGLASTEVPLRSQFASLCVLRRFGPASDAQLLLAATDRDAGVRTSAILALGMRANWQDAAARDALLALAQDKKAKVADRSEALMQLGANLRLQRLCSDSAETVTAYFTTLAANSDPKLAAMATHALAGALRRSLDGRVTDTAQK